MKRKSLDNSVGIPVYAAGAMAAFYASCFILERYAPLNFGGDSRLSVVESAAITLVTAILFNERDFLNSGGGGGSAALWARTVAVALFRLYLSFKSPPWLHSRLNSGGGLVLGLLLMIAFDETLVRVVERWVVLATESSR